MIVNKMKAKIRSSINMFSESWYMYLNKKKIISV